MRYLTVSYPAMDTEGLDDAVSALMQEGWFPFGNQYIDSGMVRQPMLDTEAQMTLVWGTRGKP